MMCTACGYEHSDLLTCEQHAADGYPPMHDTPIPPSSYDSRIMDTSGRLHAHPHILAALTAIEMRDLVAARQAVSAARRTLGNWGGPPLRTMDQVSIGLATATHTSTVAQWLAVAVDALRGDTLPGTEPWDVAQYVAQAGPGDELPPAVRAWLDVHTIVQLDCARIALQTALNMADCD